MEFVAQIKNLPLMLSFITDQARSAGLDLKRVHKVELASEEVLVNVINYAFSSADSENNRLHIHCEMRGQERFVVVVRDEGRAFNPIEKEPQLQRDIPIEERKVGGLGIYMMKQLVDDLTYERIHGENVLSLIFFIT